MRLVLDTNVALSGLLWSGAPARLIDAAGAGRIELASSTALLAELRGVLARPKFSKRLAQCGLTADDMFDGYTALVRLYPSVVIPRTIVRDPADDEVLAAALGARADLIVSGDVHLLDLKRFRDIEIVTSVTAVETLEL